MHINELDSFKLSDAVSFHDNLNPKLWRNQDLRPEVKNQLMIIARDFLEELGIKDIDVKDITISGSNAAYSYTKHSDLDLHILLDMTDYANNEVYQEFFNAKKTLYNDSHNITLHGIPVELYVQDMNQPVRSLGEYSLLQDKWLKIPSKRRANFDQTATKAKYDKLLDFINLALKLKDTEKLSTLLKKIRQYRQAGLDKGGEFGPENLAYKALRSQGYITKLYDLRDKLHSERLSIEGMYQEDYNPNGPPPGPEFKPTMPKGTVRVDVSDVYDWYKLGQHISNMKGLGKHDFGKGPPSTILAFGDEDTEHQYIKDLEKTGLTTTDIDPVDPNQPKGMKRQKVDPTFNVNEAQFNKCFDKACKLYDKAVDKGLEPVLYQVADYKGDGSNADNRWAKLPQHVWSHYVTVIGDTVFDPTAKQFGDDKEEKYSIDKLKSEWGKIFKIKPKELQEKINPEVTQNSFHAEKEVNIKDVGPLKLVAYNIDDEYPQQFKIDAITPDGKKIGYFRFVVHDYEPEPKYKIFSKFAKKKDPYVLAGNVSVWSEYQKKGIASEVYKWVKSMGNDIKPSTTQTSAGKAMWRGFEKNKVVGEEEKPKQGTKSAIYSTDVYGMTAYHSKCLEPGCDWESKRYDSIKLAQNAAQKHAQKHFKQGVAEAFDQPYKLKWEKGDHGDVDAYTQLPDGNYLSIMFNKEHNQDNEEAWSVEFYRNNSQEVTGEGDAQRVFATVLGAIQTFIKKYKPNRVIFSASKEVEPGQNAQSRANLYDRLVQRYAKSWGFKAFRADTGNKVIYELSRIKKEVEESASGYIPSNAEKDDPRFKTALTVDIKPDTMKKDAKKFGNKISRAGIPPTLKPSGKF